VRQARLDRGDELISLLERHAPVAPPVAVVNQDALEPADPGGRAETLGDSRPLHPCGIAGIQIADDLIGHSLGVEGADERLERARSAGNLDAACEILEPVQVAHLHSGHAKQGERLADTILPTERLSKSKRLRRQLDRSGEVAC
jgi:hypothetical protein